MIIVHANCNYRLSPAGFWYGSFRYDESMAAEGYTLSGALNSSFVEKIFHYSFLTDARGKLPHKSAYLYLIKGISFHYEDRGECGKDVEVNIGFEFDDIREFAVFSENLERKRKEEGFVKSLTDLVIPCPQDREYGLVIDRRKLNGLIRELTAGEGAGKVDDTIRFAVSAVHTDYRETLAEAFRLERSHIRYDGADYIFVPAKERNVKLYLFAAAVVLMFSSLGFMIIWR